MLSARKRLLLLLGAIAACAAPALLYGGGVATAPAGVEVSPEGVFRMKLFRDPAGVLLRQRLAHAKATLPADLARPSKLRKVSLNRLEAALRARLERGEFETKDMKYLAGLTRISHVFFYPETNDIVIAGPAEGYVEHESGRVTGMETGEAILELQDLVTALRAFPPAGGRTSLISVSIDPTQDGLQRMQQFLNKVGGYATPRDTQRIAQGLREALGLQNVTLQGVSPRSHMAQVLVEADYRMKMIGIGLERPAVNVKTYVDQANPRDVSRNAMQRWFFVPNYECVRVSKDDLAMKLEGSTLRLIGADEMVTADGERVSASRGNKASRTFCESFTKKYDEMAKESPVYAQLRNVVDMTIVAAFIQKMDYYGQAGWTMETFGNEDVFQVETYTHPKKVETAVNAKWKGRTLMTPIGGGVEIRPLQALHSDTMSRDADGAITSVRKQIDPTRLADGQWWWD